MSEEKPINVPRPAAETINSVSSYIQSLNNELNELDAEAADILDKRLPAAENTLDIVVNEIESARQYVTSRGFGKLRDDVLSFLPQDGGVIPSGSLQEVKDDIFKLFNEGDSALKEAAKFKLNVPPAVSDFATQIAGGLSIKNLTSLLGISSLLDDEDLASLKNIVDTAQGVIRGDMTAITGVLGDIGGETAITAFQDLQKYKNTVEGAINKGKGYIEEANRLKNLGEQKIQEAKDAYEKTKQSIETTIQSVKNEARNLENQANSLLQEAKNLPAKLRDETVAKAEGLFNDAKQKYEEAKQTGENLVKSAQQAYDSASSEAKRLLDESKEINSKPEIITAKLMTEELDKKQKEVDKIKSTVNDPTVIQKIESVVEEKTKLEIAASKAATVQEFKKKSAAVPNQDVIANHVPSEFKSFSEWVLDEKNEIYSTPQEILESTGFIEYTPSYSAYQSSKIIEPTTIKNFIIHRGFNGTIKNPTANEVRSTSYSFGKERFPVRFKSYCEFGKSNKSVVNLSKLFDGYIDKIISPVDIAIILNAGNVGMFNNTIPYGFGVGSELAAPITFQNTFDAKTSGDLFDKGGVGTGKSENWAYQPHWSGLYVNFLLDKNGIYQSDEDFIDITYAKKMEKLIKDGISYGIILKNTSPLSDIPKAFPGAIIGFYDKATRKGHVELLLKVAINGFLTLGGNIKIEGTSKIGTTHGFKFYNSLKDFSPNHEVMILRRGVKNGWTTNGRLDGKLKRSHVIDEYMRAIEDKTHPKNKKLLSGAYDLLKNHLSSVIFERENIKDNTTNGMQSLLDGVSTLEDPTLLDGSFQETSIRLDKIERPTLVDNSFKLHIEFNNYIKGNDPSQVTIISEKEQFYNDAASNQGH